MKFCELVMFFREENTIQGKDVFLETLVDSKWSTYIKWYIENDILVERGDRSILDREVPSELCRYLFSKSIRTFYLVENRYIVERGEEYPKPKVSDYKILTSLEVFENYGGTCLYIVQDRGIYSLSKRTKEKSIFITKIYNFLRS